MTFKPARHDLFARLLHWSMAALILTMLFIGVAMVSSVSLRPALLELHRPIGIASLLLAVVRLLHRLRREYRRFLRTCRHPRSLRHMLRTLPCTA